MLIRNHARMIQHLVSSYSEWWHVPVTLIDTGGFWVLKGKHYQISFPVQTNILVPDLIEMVQTPFNHTSTMLPFPGKNELWENLSVTGSAEFPVDLLTFLAGQLWCVEELNPQNATAAIQGNSHGRLADRFHFMDTPFVDLWMRYLFERVHGEPFEVEFEQKPRFWMTYDINQLRKWRLGGVIRQLFQFPNELFRGRVFSWFRNTKEALLSHFPERDPWYTVPQILASTRAICACFFWLGHPVDHKGACYDIRRKEYLSLVRQCLSEKHQIGLQGSSLHLDKPAALAAEKENLENVAASAVKLHRQHCFHIAPEKTFRHLEAMGIYLDSSLSYSDRIGFRCGSCIPIRWWDFELGSALNLIELPLPISDWTLHDPANFEPNESRHRIWNYADQVRMAGGILVLDFHEMYFSKDFAEHAAFHESVLEGLWMRSWRDWHPEPSNAND